ncbi:unnamed protein product [Leuciscus chuanchicus]
MRKWTCLLLKKRHTVKRTTFTPGQNFTSRCGECQVDLVNCPIGSVLEFLQDCFSTQSLGRNPLVSRWYRDEACNSCKCAMAVEGFKGQHEGGAEQVTQSGRLKHLSAITTEGKQDPAEAWSG